MYTSSDGKGTVGDGNEFVSICSCPRNYITLFNPTFRLLFRQSHYIYRPTSQMAKYTRLMWNHSHGNASIDGWSQVILILLVIDQCPVLKVVQETSRVSPAIRGRVPPPQNFIYLFLI